MMVSDIRSSSLSLTANPDIKNEKRVNLNDSINRVTDDMVKDAKICSTNQDIVKNYSHAEYNVKDFHPGSNDVLLDIVHPSLFPYIRY